MERDRQVSGNSAAKCARKKREGMPDSNGRVLRLLRARPVGAARCAVMLAFHVANKTHSVSPKENIMLLMIFPTFPEESNYMSDI